MADRKSSTSRKSPENSQNLDTGRNPEQYTSNGGMSQESSRLTSPPPQTNTSPQLQSVQQLTSRDMDQADRNPSNQPVQSQQDSSDTQLEAASFGLNVVNSKGPVQLGAESTVNNPVYNNCNIHQHYHYHPAPFHPVHYNDYLRWTEQQAAALGPSPQHPGLPPCPVSPRLAGVQLQDHREENTTDISGQSQTHRKTAESSSHHDNNSSFHVPCHCSDCLKYHERDHPPLPELSGPESESRHSGLSHHPVPQLLPGPQNTEQKESTKKDEDTGDRQGRQNTTSITQTQNQTQFTTTTTQSRGREPHDVRHHVTSVQQGGKSGVVSQQYSRQTKGKKLQQKPETQRQKLSNTRRPSPSDVTPDVARTEQRDGRGAQTVKTGQREQKGNVQSQRTETVLRPGETSPVYSEGIPDSVCIIDSKGLSLEPGDAVWFDRDGDRNRGIYVGGQEVVWSEGMRGGWLVHKGELKLTDPFGKLTVHNIVGDVRPFPRGEVIRRAESRVGAHFTEGDSVYGLDFPVWAMCGMGYDQARSRGFWLLY